MLYRVTREGDVYYVTIAFMTSAHFILLTFRSLFRWCVYKDLSSIWTCHLHTSVLRFPGGFMIASSGGTIMESSSGRSNLSSTKTERKVSEKNRRNQMKTLYSKLNSLLPDKESTVIYLPPSLNLCLLMLLHSSLLSCTFHEEAKLSLLWSCLERVRKILDL
jgi:hypothetical protein